MRRLGVDVGGTFTDLIYVDDDAGKVLVHKLPTTVEDPSIGTIDGIQALIAAAGESLEQVDQVHHGTTIATNIVIEHNGAEVGLITTEGYRDILHIARHKKPLNFSNYQDLPWQKFPIVRRRHRRTVAERVGADGSVIVPLDEEGAREEVRRLKAAGVEAIAVCFLFSFLNDGNEQTVKQIIQEEFPEAFLSVSSEVLPQYREYERFSTVCLNAYVGPKVARYIRRLTDELRSLGVRTDLHLMTSASGVATADSAIERPVNLLMSGPVAGVVGGIWAGKNAGFESVITLDVGGTSADIGLSQSGSLRMKHLLDTKVGAYHAMIPIVDVDTIGAGGGSIAYVDGGGIYRVGPRSAGAKPGPAAYGRGGTDPTATDAMVNLGWLVPEDFLGGEMTLDADEARRVFELPAGTLGMSVEEASFGAVQILVHSMVQAIEENSVRKGYDPRDFALVAAGGAGPLFAAQVAIEVGTPTALIPPYPGITSALGLLATDMVYEYAATAFQRVSAIDVSALQRRFAELEAEARQQLEKDGVPLDEVLLQRVADCRYVGQGYELRVEAAGGAIDEAWVAKLRADFHSVHERTYSRRFEDADIEIPNIRVRAVGLMPPLQMPEVEAGDPSPPVEALRHVGYAWFQVDGELKHVSTSYYDREALKARNVIQGPAIIHQYDSTTVIPPAVTATIDAVGNILVATGSSAVVDSLEALVAGKEP